MRQRSLAAARAFVNSLTSVIGADELGLALALGLIAVGLWSVWRPGSFLVPGVILLWIALPARRPFIERLPLEKTLRGRP